MEDYQKNKQNSQRKSEDSTKFTNTNLEALDSINLEPVDNYTDFLYWREPIATLELDDVVLTSESNKVQESFAEKTIKPKIKQNLTSSSVVINSSNVKGKSSSNKRKSKTNKKQIAPRLINNTSHKPLSSEKGCVVVGKNSLKCFFNY